ncbi:cytochrome b [Microbulbifer discodermiae]|uniref:cytochrome b n=1 Tax=Microbulbifer sp. 2201CG32-9 TaxID=3232309 RepID=UPI00345C22CB
MDTRNTANSYGSIAKWLHWTIAIFFLGSYVSVYYRHWFTAEETPENWIALQLHLSIGITLAAFIALRILWRITNKTPDLEPGTRLEHLAAHVGHYALYAIMIIMPITGYIGTSVDTEYFFLFDIPKFETTKLYEVLVTQGMGISFEEFEQPIDFIHTNLFGEWIVWLLILAHVAAALYHHFFKKDKTLIRMTIGNS